MGMSRRPFLQALIGLPVVSVIAGFFSARDKKELMRSTPEYQKMFEGISIMRMVNTAALFHRKEFGRYPALPELWRASKIDKWMASEQAITANYPKLYRDARFEREEILPGWQFKFKSREGGEGYLAQLAESPQRFGLPLITTDEKGLILQGVPTSDVTFASTWDAKALIIGHPIRVQHQAPKQSLLKSLALGVVAPVHAQEEEDCSPCCSSGECCCEFPCSCGLCLSCQNGHPGGGAECISCGCECCVFCCCLWA